MEKEVVIPNMKLNKISITGEAKFIFDIDMMIDKDYNTRTFEQLQNIFLVEIIPGKNQDL